MEFLASISDWIKALHLISVISWMAGLFYLPRLFVYHAQADVGSEQDKTFQIMERKLLKIIMNPAMIAAWIFGIILYSVGSYDLGADFWMTLKLAAVVAMTVFHMALARWRRMFSEGRNVRDERFYRRTNEIPTMLMILIVVMAIVQPF